MSNQLNYRQEIVLDYIKDNPLCNTKDIFKSFDYDMHIIRKIISELIRKEKIDSHYLLKSTRLRMYKVKEDNVLDSDNKSNVTRS